MKKKIVESILIFLIKFYFRSLNTYIVFDYSSKATNKQEKYDNWCINACKKVRSSSRHDKNKAKMIFKKKKDGF